MIWIAIAVVLGVAMVLSTKFLNPEELAATQPEVFDPAAEAAELFGKAQSELPGSAQPLGDVIVAVQADPDAAADEFDAVRPNDTNLVFPVEITAEVLEVSDVVMTLDVDGIPSETLVTVPLNTAVNGSVIRDVMGFKFADAPGQTQYQYVGDELKKLMIEAISAAVPDPAAAAGQNLRIVGAVTVLAGDPPAAAKPIMVQPISIEVVSP